MMGGKARRPVGFERCVEDDRRCNRTGERSNETRCCKLLTLCFETGGRPEFLREAG